jgi:hypothetical protein
MTRTKKCLPAPRQRLSVDHRRSTQNLFESTVDTGQGTVRIWCVGWRMWLFLVSDCLSPGHFPCSSRSFSLFIVRIQGEDKSLACAYAALILQDGGKPIEAVSFFLFTSSSSDFLLELLPLKSRGRDMLRHDCCFFCKRWQKLLPFLAHTHTLSHTHTHQSANEKLFNLILHHTLPT